VAALVSVNEFTILRQWSVVFFSPKKILVPRSPSKLTKKLMPSLTKRVRLKTH
jgi:hypothetical protein